MCVRSSREAMQVMLLWWPPIFATCFKLSTSQTMMELSKLPPPLARNARSPFPAPTPCTTHNAQTESVCPVNVPSSLNCETDYCQRHNLISLSLLPVASSSLLITAMQLMLLLWPVCNLLRSTRESLLCFSSESYCCEKVTILFEFNATLLAPELIELEFLKGEAIFLC